jgi:hypothetical protein
MHTIINKLNESLVQDAQWNKLTSHNNRWSLDPVFKDYHKLGNKQKGVLGEEYTERLMLMMGSCVKPPKHTDYDRIIDGYKTEIKFSLAVSDSKKDVIIYDKFMINHIAKSKDWDRLLFVGINPPEGWNNVKRNKSNLSNKRCRAYFMEKEDFVKHMKTEKSSVFSHQQSGEKGKNDDYICTKFSKFIELDFVKEIGEW